MDKIEKNNKKIKNLNHSIVIDKLKLEKTNNDIKTITGNQKILKNICKLIIVLLPIINISIVLLPLESVKAILLMILSSSMGIGFIVKQNSLKKRANYYNSLIKFDKELMELDEDIKEKKMELGLRKQLNLSYNGHNINDNEMIMIKKYLNNSVLDKFDSNELYELNNIIDDEDLKIKHKEVLSKELIKSYKKGMKESFKQIKNESKYELFELKEECYERTKIFIDSVNKCDSLEELYRAKEVLEQREIEKQKIKR